MKVFIDCNAADGSTLEQFWTVERYDDFKIVCVESDPRYLTALRDRVDEFSDQFAHGIILCNFLVEDARGIREADGRLVATVTLPDLILRTTQPEDDVYLKVDGASGAMPGLLLDDYVLPRVRMVYFSPANPQLARQLRERGVIVADTW